MNFTIVSPVPYTTRWGGVCALYQLADAISVRGHGACVEVEPDLMRRGSLDKSRRDVVVLPEVYYANPTTCPSVVRWILNIPGKCGPGNGDGYLVSDLLFLWSEAYRFPAKSEPAGLLFVISDWREGLFLDRGGRRRGTCYMVRKGADKPRDQHPPDALCLDDYQERGGDRYLADAFNRFERFISYDHATLFSHFAALCGCESVIIPDGVRTVDEAARDDILGLAGSAWGWDDLPRARKTRCLLPGLIADFKARSIASVDHFIQVCHERFP